MLLQRRSGGAGLRLVVEQRVDHHVADETDALGGNAFAQQVGFGAALGGVQAVGHLVGQHAVDFFGHLAVVAAQTRLDMNDRHALLHRHQGAGQGGVDVADHEHRAGPALVDHRLKAAHDLGCLHRVAARADFEVDVGLRQAQILEQPVAHVAVVMLAGVHQQGRHRRHMGGEGAQDWRHLHEVGPRADDAQDRAGQGFVRSLSHWGDPGPRTTMRHPPDPRARHAMVNSPAGWRPCRCRPANGGHRLRGTDP